MNKTCTERIDYHYRDTMETLRKLWAQHCDDPEAYDDDLGNLYEYGLSFDYVAPGTFTDQTEGYFRYQLSWGGPSDEFRIYADRRAEYNWSIYRVEYWFLDWSDGAKIVLSGDDLEFMTELLEGFFVEVGTFDYQYNEAVE